MTTPRVGAPEMATSQTGKEETHNEGLRYVEQGAGHFTFKDRDLATPPGSPADGDAYLVASSPTGAWTGHTGDIAFYMDTAWAFIEPQEGMTAWLEDENTLLVFYGASWLSFAASKVNSQSGTTYTFDFIDTTNVVEFTNGSAVTATIPTNASKSFPVGTVIEIHQGGAGTVTIAAAGGVTLQSRGGLTGTAGQYAIAAIRKVATDTWRLTGDIA